MRCALISAVLVITLSLMTACGGTPKKKAEIPVDTSDRLGEIQGELSHQINEIGNGSTEIGKVSGEIDSLAEQIRDNALTIVLISQSLQPGNTGSDNETKPSTTDTEETPEAGGDPTDPPADGTTPPEQADADQPDGQLNEQQVGQVVQAADSKEQIRIAAARVSRLATEIATLNTRLRVHQENATRQLEKLSEQVQRVRVLEDTAKNLRRQIDEAEAKAKREARKTLNRIFSLVIVLGVLATIGGGLLTWYAPKFGLPLAGVGAGAVVLGIVLIQYYEQIALWGFIAFIVLMVVGAGILGWTIWRAKAEGDTAADTTKLVELMKPLLPKTERIEVFGDGVRRGIAHSLQRPTTKLTVERHRKSIATKEAFKEPLEKALERRARETRAPENPNPAPPTSGPVANPDLDDHQN